MPDCLDPECFYIHHPEGHPHVGGSGQPAGKSEGLDDAGPVPDQASPRRHASLTPGLNERRAERDGYETCSHCGSAYFRLVEFQDDGSERQGVVTLNPGGTVAGRTGTPVCDNCDTPAAHLAPPVPQEPSR